jgi:hypothetical protein
MVARTSMVRSESVEYSLWLAFDERGGLRMTRTQPALDRNERALALILTVPRSIFATPQLRATITIDDPGIPRPTIDVAAAAAALREVIGCDIEICVVAPGEAA